MAGMAASVSLFRRNIDGADRDTIKFDRTTQDVGRNIDKLSGRLGLLVDVAATLGPALIPTAAAAVPLLAGLSNQLGFVAIAGGSTILAFQGVGDALKALNEQQLNPSAANLEKLHEAMATLGPAGRDFVRELQAMRPELQKLQDAAQAGLFPGMTEGITSLTTRLPQAQRIISEVTDTLGGLLADAGESLAGHQWDDFFNMLESEARPTLQDLGESIGQVTKGLADLWVAFAPLNRDFSQGFLHASESFAQWADGLSRTQGFADFMAYLHETGPQVAQTLGALSKALLDVLEAVAPLGGPALAAIQAFSEAISAIANSDLGTPLLGAIAVWRAYSMAVSLAGKATRSFVGQQALARTGFGSFKKDMGTFMAFGAQSRGEIEKQRAAGARLRGTFLKGAAGAAALGVAASGVADKFGLANTVTLALAGSMVGPWGTAAGAAAGAAIDLAHANDGLNDSLAKLAQMAGNVDFATFNKQLDDAQSKVNDLKHVTGVGDWFSDAFGQLGNVISGKGLDGGVANAQKKVNASEAKQDSSLRERGAAIANAQMLASSKLAAQGFRLTAAGAREAAGGVNAFAFAIRGANAALTRQGTLDAYRSSLLDLADSLKQNGKTLATNTRAGLANRAAIRGIATSALEAAGNMKNFANRTKFLQSARKDFISAATAAGMTRAAAKRLADQLGLVSRIRAKPRIDLQGVDKGISQAHALRAAIAAVQSKSVTITTIVRRRAGAPGSITAQADGGTIPGQRQPYGDKVLLFGAPGEEVITNRHGEADRFRADRAAGRIPHYAGGGTIQRLAGGGSVRRHPNRHDNDPTPHVNHFAQALKEATKSLNREKSARDALVSKRNDLAGNVRDQFLTDPFGQSNVWAEGGGNPLGILKADIAKANAFKGSLAQLRKNGLSGDALASIASTGDIGKAQALLSMGKGGLSQYQTLFNERAHAAAAVGSYAGSAAYGAAIASQTHDIRQLNATVHRLEQQLKHRHAQSQKNHKKNADDTGKAVAKGVNHAASKAKRRSR